MTASREFEKLKSDSVENRSNIAHKTVQSGAWLYGQRIATTIVNLIVMAILARELEPAQFGLVALAGVLMRFNVAAGAATVGNYVIYDHSEKRLEKTHAAFWLNLALTLLTVGIFVAAMPLISKVYSEPLLPLILGLILIQFFFSQARAVPDALVKRSLDFQKLVARDTFLNLISGGLSVVLALLGWGVWSLVVPGVIVAPVQFLVVLAMSGWRPSLSLHFHYWREVFAYTKHIIGTQILNTINSDGDTLLMGRLLGTTALGLYNMAWNSASLANRHIVGIIASVAMPSLSALKEHPAALRGALLRMLRLLSIVTFPALLGLFVVADDFIVGIYGEKWLPSVLPLRILIIFSLRRSIGSPATVVYNVVGRPDVGFKFGLFFMPFYLASIYFGSPYGIVGVAAGVTLTRTVGGFISMYLAGKLVRVSMLAMFTAVRQALEASLIMMILIYLLKLLLHTWSLPALVILVLTSATGAAVYLALLLTRYTVLLDEIMLVLEALSEKLAHKVRMVLRRTGYASVST